VTAAATQTGARPVRAGRRPPLAWIGTMPFLAYTGIFLLLPTGIVIWNAFRRPTGGFTFSNISALNTSTVRSLFVGSFELPDLIGGRRRAGRAAGLCRGVRQS